MQKIGPEKSIMFLTRTDQKMSYNLFSRNRFVFAGHGRDENVFSFLVLHLATCVVLMQGSLAAAAAGSDAMSDMASEAEACHV